MIASSSQLSHNRRTTSTASAASSNSSSASADASRRPNSAASWAVELTRGCQPARPCDTWSSVAMALERWNGSVWVTVATGIRPMCSVSGAIRAATRTASPRPANRRGLSGACRPGLGLQAVVNGEEIQQPALGGLRQTGPVPAGQHRGRRGVGGQRGPPGVRVPSVAVQRDTEVQLWVIWRRSRRGATIAALCIVVGGVMTTSSRKRSGTPGHAPAAVQEAGCSPSPRIALPPPVDGYPSSGTPADSRVRR